MRILVYARITRDMIDLSEVDDGRDVQVTLLSAETDLENVTDDQQEVTLLQEELKTILSRSRRAKEFRSEPPGMCVQCPLGYAARPPGAPY